MKIYKNTLILYSVFFTNLYGLLGLLSSFLIYKTVAPIPLISGYLVGAIIGTYAFLYLSYPKPDMLFKHKKFPIVLSLFGTLKAIKLLESSDVYVRLDELFNREFETSDNLIKNYLNEFTMLSGNNNSSLQTITLQIPYSELGKVYDFIRTDEQFNKEKALYDVMYKSDKFLKSTDKVKTEIRFNNLAKKLTMIYTFVQENLSYEITEYHLSDTHLKSALLVKTFGTSYFMVDTVKKLIEQKGIEKETVPFTYSNQKELMEFLIKGINIRYNLTGMRLIDKMLLAGYTSKFLEDLDKYRVELLNYQPTGQFTSKQDFDKALDEFNKNTQ